MIGYGALAAGLWLYGWDYVLPSAVPIITGYVAYRGISYLGWAYPSQFLKWAPVALLPVSGVSIAVGRSVENDYKGIYYPEKIGIIAQATGIIGVTFGVSFTLYNLLTGKFINYGNSEENMKLNRDNFIVDKHYSKVEDIEGAHPISPITLLENAPELLGVEEECCEQEIWPYGECLGEYIGD